MLFGKQLAPLFPQPLVSYIPQGPAGWRPIANYSVASVNFPVQFLRQLPALCRALETWHGKDYRSGHESCEKVDSGDRADSGSISARGRGRIISTMTLKSAALFALVGMILQTVMLALDFFRDISAFTAGAISANTMLVSLVHLLVSLSVTVFFYVFYSKES